MFCTTIGKGNDLTKDEAKLIMVKKFIENLIEGDWYDILYYSKILLTLLLCLQIVSLKHMSIKKVQLKRADIFKIEQGDFELLGDFIERFHRERMMLLMVLDDWPREGRTSSKLSKVISSYSGLIMRFHKERMTLLMVLDDWAANTFKKD